MPMERKTTPQQAALKEQINHKGWTYTELGKRAGIHFSLIGKLISGERRITFATARKLGQVFNMSWKHFSHEK
jgi:plasmid maintenance system antidote protein VapI